MNLIGISGYSGSGKTTLIEKVIPVLADAGLRVSLIKHAHHEFDIDQPGKDTWRHRRAGATQVLISSSQRWALMHELRDEPEPSVFEHAATLTPCDIVIVEGFKSDPFPKIEVHRADARRPFLFPADRNVIAIATDQKLDSALPQIDINDGAAVAAFIMRYFGFSRALLKEVKAAS